MKRQLSLFLALWMLLTCLVSPAFADGQTVRDSAVFTNIKNTMVGLTVTKQVVNENDSHPANPEASFTFALNVRDDIGRNQPYQFFNSAGKRVVKYYDWNDKMEHTATEDEVAALGRDVIETPFFTDANGRFALKAGETAVFTGLNEGTSYRVMEVDMPDDFTQIEPVEPEGYSGTVSADSGVLTFTNRYHWEPEIIPGGDDQAIRITKNLVQVPGVTLPQTDKAFTFQVEIDGEALAGKSFLIMDNATGQFIDEGKTDENGRLSIQGGQYALLQKLPRFSIYNVAEVLPEPGTEEPGDHWWPVGVHEFSDVLNQNTPLLLDFNNAHASFGVKKTMRDGSQPDTLFSFQLEEQLNDGSYASWSNAAYYLYNASGELADEALHTTNSFGAFQLKAGQTAIFVGAEPGKVFAVKENAMPGFVQTLPADPSGYRDQTIQANKADIIPFENDVQETAPTLSVNKTVKTESAGFDASTQFVFKLQKKASNGDLTPVAQAVYTLNENTLRTDEEGLFTLKADETAYFTRLIINTNYQVDELGVMKADGSVDEEALKDYYTEPSGSQTGILKSDGLNLDFVNYYNSTAALKLTKVDAEDDTLKLSGAEFKLYKLLDNNEIDPSFQEVPLTTVTDGTAALEEIVSGRYALLETKAPTGYIAPEGAFVFEISVKNGTVTAVADVEGAAPAEWISGEMDTSGTIHVMVRNGFYRLPKTGGMGTMSFTVSGMLLLSLALVYWFLQKKYEIKKGRRV